MGLHHVKRSIDRVKEFILQEYPNYYKESEETKMGMIHVFVHEQDAHEMYEYMMRTSNEFDG